MTGRDRSGSSVEALLVSVERISANLSASWSALESAKEQAGAAVDALHQLPGQLRQLAQTPSWTRLRDSAGGCGQVADGAAGVRAERQRVEEKSWSAIGGNLETAGLRGPLSALYKASIAALD